GVAAIVLGHGAFGQADDVLEVVVERAVVALVKLEDVERAGREELDRAAARHEVEPERQPVEARARTRRRRASEEAPEQPRHPLRPALRHRAPTEILSQGSQLAANGSGLSSICARTLCAGAPSRESLSRSGGESRRTSACSRTEPSRPGRARTA